MDVQPSDVVRDLGVLLDSELTLKYHVNRIASTCFYHLRRLRQLKRHVGVEFMKQLISSFIFSRQLTRLLQRAFDRSVVLHYSSFATGPERRRTSTSGIVAA